MLSEPTIDSLQARAAELARNGDHAGAAVEYGKLLEQSPDSYQALVGLGLALIRTGRVEDGIQSCAKAALLRPDDAEVRYAYGYALGSAQRFGEATEHLDAALSIQPNHLGAKQALVFSLVAQGNALVAGNDAYNSERYYDRAHKLDPNSPEITAALLNAYYLTQQKGKLLKVYQDLDVRIREHAALKPLVDRLQADPDYQTGMKQAAYAAGPAAPAKPQPQTLQQIPCPNCRQMIMEWAAVCPHCSFQIKAMGTFATHDRGPNVIWQEATLSIMAIVWCLVAGYNIWIGLKIQFEMIRSILVTMAGASFLVGLGLLLRIEWVGFVAKILCCLNILGSMYGLLWATALTSPGAMWLAVGVNLLQIGIYGFLIYLINYSMD